MSTSLAILPFESHTVPQMQDEWIPRDRVTELTGWTRQWINALVKDGKLVARESSRKLTGGRFALEYSVVSLPLAARERHERDSRALAPAPTTSLSLFPQPRLVATGPRVKVAAKHLPMTDARLQILQPILDYKAHVAVHGNAQTVLSLADGSKVASVSQMVRYQAETALCNGERVSEATLWRWLRKHEEGGVAELARRPRSDAGQSRWFAQHRDAAALVAFLYLGDGFSPGLSVQACHDMLLKQCELVGIRRYEVPSRVTVGAFLASMPNALRVFAREGRRKYEEQMLPYLSRGYTEPSNQIWVSDHMIADVEVINNCFPDVPYGTPIRLRLTAILDWRSRYLVGYCWAWEGTSASIARAVRYAVTEHGPCDLWYVDNGKDYIKVAKGAVPGYVGRIGRQEWAEREMAEIDRTGIMARLGIRVTHCIAHHPQSKHIERFFRTVHLTFCKLWWTYTGGKPSERPDSTTALMAITRSALRHDQMHRSQHPPATVFMACFEQWLKAYHAQPRTMRGMDGRSAERVFREERDPAQRPAPPLVDLAVMLAEHTSAKVSECQIRVNKKDYAPRDGQQSHIMHMLNGQRVSVAYDPGDDDCVAVLDEHGAVLTLLERKSLVRMAPDDRDTQLAIAASMQQRNALRRTTRETQEAISRAARSIGVRHPIELLATAAATNQQLTVDPERIAPRTAKVRSIDKPTTAPMYARDVAASILRQKGQ